MKSKNRADLCIAQGALTNSKRPESFIGGVYPTHADWGKGSTLSCDKKIFIDFICGLGSNLMGYGNPLLLDTLVDRYKRGATLSLSSVEELDCAEKLKSIFPFTDLWKFGKNGSDVCMAAIRCARTYHGVRYENETMYSLQGNPELQSISQGQNKKDWHTRALQVLCEDIYAITKNCRDSSNIPEEIPENSPRISSGKTKEGEELKVRNKQGERQNKLFDKDWKVNEDALRKMWEHASSRASHELQRPNGDNVVMPRSSRTGSPRVIVLSDGYHGVWDGFIGLSEPRCGVIKDPYIYRLTGNEHLIKDAAAVIIEPVELDYSKDRFNYLKHLRAECTKHGTLLIFDEIITGFRFKGLSVSNYFGVRPDIVLIGKAMGGGLPISAMGGKKEIMNCGEYFYSGTFFGETCAMALCIKTIDLLHDARNKYNIDELWTHGQAFLDKFNSFTDKLKIVGYPTRGSFQGDELFKALFWQETCKAGILFGPSWFYNFDHIDASEIVLHACKDIVMRINSGLVKLEGKMPESPFSAKMRGQK